MKKVILAAACSTAFVSMANAATTLPVIESGTWFFTTSALSNETVTVFGTSGTESVNTNGGFRSLFVVDTQAFVGTITGGTIAFSINAGGAGIASHIAVDFMGTTADNDFDESEGFAFASGSAVSSILGQTEVIAENNSQAFDITLSASQIAGSERYAVYRFYNPTVPNGTNSNQQSGINNFVVEAVPEPSTAVLFGFASLALLRRRRA
ncbi:MAG: PEP-CTERM sorting domain-containing protein [Luteolibacter sp.]